MSHSRQTVLVIDDSEDIHDLVEVRLRADALFVDEATFPQSVQTKPRLQWLPELPDGNPSREIIRVLIEQIDWKDPERAQLPTSLVTLEAPWPGKSVHSSPDCSFSARSS